jgi:hypothetical protein
MGEDSVETWDVYAATESAPMAGFLYNAGQKLSQLIVEEGRG